jgi:hypothetical protein
MLRTLLSLALSLFVVFAWAYSPGEVVRLPSTQLGVTQQQVGIEVIDRMLGFWAQGCLDLACLKEKIIAKALNNPLPGIEMPSMVPGEAGRRVYITDGHHRASGIHRLLNAPLNSLPPEIQRALGPNGQQILKADPNFYLPVKIESVYDSLPEALRAMAINGKGQFSAETLARHPEFATAQAQGQLADLEAKHLSNVFKELPAGLEELKDSPMRSAVGTLFFELDLNGVDYVDYVEFKIAERLNAQGVSLLPGSALSPANLQILHHEFLGRAENVDYLKSLVRPGHEAQARSQAGWSKLTAPRAPTERRLDVVFDIDQTIATLVHEGRPDGDWLADPKNPRRGTVEVQFTHGEVDSYNRPVFDRQGRPIRHSVKERYRVYDGFVETMERLKPKIKSGEVRVSFFSGGFVERNQALLESIKLSDGTSVRALVGDSNILGRDLMSPTGLGPEHRVRERFKKDLRHFAPELRDVIIVDDIATFVPDSQRPHLMGADETFPYPERVRGVDNPRIPTAAEIARERGRFKENARHLFQALDAAKTESKPLVEAIKPYTAVPMAAPGCAQEDFFQILNRLLTPAAI